MPLDPPTEPVETVEVETATVGCDGDGPSGHPLVYLKLSPRGVADCPYCGRRFVRRDGAPPQVHD